MKARLAAGLFVVAAIGAATPAHAAESVEVWTGEGPDQRITVPLGVDGVASTLHSLAGSACFYAGLQNDPDHQFDPGTRLCRFYYHLGGGEQDLIGIDDLVSLRTTSYHSPRGSSSRVILKLGAASKPSASSP